MSKCNNNNIELANVRRMRAISEEAVFGMLLVLLIRLESEENLHYIRSSKSGAIVGLYDGTEQTFHWNERIQQMEKSENFKGK